MAGSLVAGATPVSAQNYPDRVVRVITTPAGSGSDFAARLISQALTRSFAQQVIVDNRGNTAAEIVIKSPADGYTLLCWGSPVWITQFLLESLAWDPVRMVRQPRYAKAARKLKLVFVDCGVKDEWHLDLGARMLAKEMKKAGARVVHEDFDDGHMDIQYRYDRSLEALSKVL